jgi:protoporphyrinogen/coproporphyrinogen III oxidase
MKPVVIVGAGLAGLTAATFLRRHGVPVRVFEAGKNIAGLARSERDADGFTYDFGAHFITNRLAAAVGVSANCRAMPRYGETVWLRGRAYSYPFGLMRSLPFALSAASAKAANVFRKPALSAQSWYRWNYGRKLADAVAIPITEAWSGERASELAASVGQKFATSLPRTIMLKTAARVTGRTVAVGYSGTVPESPHVWHVYPEGGIGSVCERLADEVRDVVQTQSPVEAILVENDRAVGVRVAGADIEAAGVISTAPVHVLPKISRGTDKLAYLARFRYRPMVFVNVKLDGPSGLPDVVTWTPSAETPFFRLSDIGMGLPWLVPAGKSLVTCDIGCQVGDATWTAPDAELGKLCVAALDRLVPGVSGRYLGCRVMRTPLAYPVYRLEYEEDRKRFEQGTGIEGLVSVGRNGEFAHILMEDVFWRTRRKVMQLIGSAVPEEVPQCCP